jgi:glycosyltransferase involved in cell wall biosynthesis
MKIAHFISTKDLRACGVLTAVLAISEAQSHLGHKVKIFISLPSQSFFVDRLKLSCESFVCYIKSTFNFINLILNYRIIKDEIHRFSPDIVHLHSVYSINNFLSAIIANNIGLPYAVSPHGGYSPQIRNRRSLRKRLFEIMFDKNIIKNASTCFVVSDSELEMMRALQWSIPQMELIGNPLPFDLSKSDNDSYSSVPSHKFRILYVGRLDIRHKGLDLAIRAIGRLPVKTQNNLQIYFLAPKDSKHINKLQEIASQANVSANIIFSGHKNGQEKIDIIKSANLLFLTSRWEAFGYSALEAMALGIPIVLTDCVPLSYLTIKYNCGWSCKAREESICSAFEKALELHPRELKEMGKRGRDIVFREFDPHRISSLLCNAYKQMISNNN